MTGAVDGDSNSDNGNFMCGVVEGFYGRPWTTGQRRDLFQKMRKFGLNTYLYAPKDDYKHRAYWRDLYSVEEADHLSSLVEAAREQEITFVYAISPGIDITFSSTKDVTYLKRKLEQVSRFGCSAFALLFDDIETEMCAADKEIFQSFAHAQVSVTNEIYQHLNQPTFLFCPTEYCATRAVPTVTTSEYLTTIGTKLLLGIDVMWTGCKVIAKTITLDSIKEISSVIRRAPVIWDNIHANDYDQKRLFLGPYEGRVPEIIPHLRGVLTNPNCEYHCNFVPLHTLAQWSKSFTGLETKSPSPVSEDIKLETEGEVCDSRTSMNAAYQPKCALKLAINDWLPDFYVKLDCHNQLPPVVTTLPPDVANVHTCMAITPSSQIPPVGIVPPLEDNAAPVLNGLANDSLMQPIMHPINSLIDTNHALTAPATVEPMECVPLTSLIAKMDSPRIENGHAHEQMSMDVECERSPVCDKEASRLNTDDLTMLVDLFYLPYAHGARAETFLSEFYWLKTNAHLVNKTMLTDDPCQQEWMERAEVFHQNVRHVQRLVDLLFKIPNRALLYDLYPYIWDMRGILSLLNSYVKWLAIGHVPYVSACYLARSITWCTTGFKEAFMSGDQEPWVFRGGLQADFQRMLPLENAPDLFVMKAPEEPVTETYVIRPYLPADQTSVYNLCQKYSISSPTKNGNPLHNDVFGDKLVGGLLTSSSQYCFVLEDSASLCGYALAALDSRNFQNQMESVYDVEMKEKYPKPVRNGNKSLSSAEEAILGFYQERVPICGGLYSKYPSIIKMDMDFSRIKEQASVRRLLACVLSALKSNGSHGVHCEVSVDDKDVIDNYQKLGFIDVTSAVDSAPQGTVFLGRIM